MGRTGGIVAIGKAVLELSTWLWTGRLSVDMFFVAGTACAKALQWKSRAQEEGEAGGVGQS